jgi:hypothetical protein
MEQSPAIRRPEGFAPLEAGLPDWMKTQPLGPGRNETPSEELPDWLKHLDGSNIQPESEADTEGGEGAFPGPASTGSFQDVDRLDSITGSVR